MCRVRLRLRLRFRPRFCRRQSTDYQQFRDSETLTISMWSTDAGDAGADKTGGNYRLLTQMGRCKFCRAELEKRKLMFIAPSVYVFIFLWQQSRHDQR